MIGHAKSERPHRLAAASRPSLPCSIIAADTSNDDATPSIAAQSNDAANLHSPAEQSNDGAISRNPERQPAGSTTLEVAPQPSAKVPAPDKQETTEQRAFRHRAKTKSHGSIAISIRTIQMRITTVHISGSISSTRPSAISAWRSMASK